jgi:hypothetical protein
MNCGWRWRRALAVALAGAASATAQPRRMGYISLRRSG